MIAGLTNRRNFTLPVPDPPKSDWSGDQVTEAGLRQKAVGFNCLNYKKDPEPTLFRHFLPDKAYLDANCPDGIRMEVMFPSCWNGEPDSGDHMSHVVYPDQVITGNCPKGFNKRVISLMYETIWDTRAFSGRKGQYVLSNGDTTGMSSAFSIGRWIQVNADERMIKDMAIMGTSLPDGIPTSCNEPSRLARTHPARSRIVRCSSYSRPTTWRNARLKRPRRSKTRIASACARVYLVTVSVFLEFVS